MHEHTTRPKEYPQSPPGGLSTGKMISYLSIALSLHDLFISSLSPEGIRACQEEKKRKKKKNGLRSLTHCILHHQTYSTQAFQVSATGNKNETGALKAVGTHTTGCEVSRRNAHMSPTCQKWRGSLPGVRHMTTHGAHKDICRSRGGDSHIRVDRVTQHAYAYSGPGPR